MKQQPRYGTPKPQSRTARAAAFVLQKQQRKSGFLRQWQQRVGKMRQNLLPKDTRFGEALARLRHRASVPWQSQ